MPIKYYIIVNVISLSIVLVQPIYNTTCTQTTISTNVSAKYSGQIGVELINKLFFTTQFLF